jgi:acylphosphatase
MVRYTVHFSGNVQGVGFRYTATHIARRFDIAGYVQNLPDGRVKLVAEGDPLQVLAFVEAVRDRLSRWITGHTVETGKPTGEFGQPDSPDTFFIRY